MRKRFFVGIFAINLLVGCQANYIRDVQGGTVAPSSSWGSTPEPPKFPA
ncbi:TPA: colicin release lysis protein [Escherichia coli]|nr:colicin release lysis protein [Escherichia coli]